MIDDPVMRGLLHPVQKGFLTLPETGRILFINAAFSPALASCPKDRAVIWQWWKGPASALEQAGFIVSARRPQGPFEAVFLRLPRQREEALALLARSGELLSDDGFLVAAAANDAGGGRLAGDVSPFCPALQEISKHRCRIVWMRKADLSPLPATWLARGDMRRHEKTGLWTMPGLFSWDRTDPATALLLPFIPSGTGFSFADPGCGTGLVSLEILRRNPGLTALEFYDADARAVDICQKNIGEQFPSQPVKGHWADLSGPGADTPVDCVVMNPPFHQDRAQSVMLGRSFIARAAGMLRPGGCLLMVANAHLPYEFDLRNHFKTLEKKHEGQGFKIFEARR